MERRCKNLRISNEALIYFLRCIAEEATTLPEDASILKVQYDFLTDCFDVVLHSKEFPTCEEGVEIPRMDSLIVAARLR